MRRSFRPTNSVVNGDLAKGATGWGGNLVTLTAANNELIATLTGLSTVTGPNQAVYCYAGHKYYTSVQIKPKYATAVSIGLDALKTSQVLSDANIWQRKSAIQIATATGNTAFVFYHTTNSGGYVIGDEFRLKEFMVIDLSLCLPATLLTLSDDDLKTWCGVNIPFWFDRTLSSGRIGGIGGLH
jgi:hypothetical protein